MKKKTNTLDTDMFSDFETISAELFKAKKKNQDIIRALDIGLFFLNAEFNILGEYSSAFEEIINQKELSDVNFFNILTNKVPENIITNTREYLELMFREDLEEEVINEMNPLLKSEFHFENEWGIWEFSKHLSFRFERIINKGKIDCLVCIVKDVTKEDSLEKQLKQVEENAKKQMDWLVNILHVEPPLLKEFVYVTENELELIDKAIKNPTKLGDHKSILRAIVGSINNIISNVSFLDLKFFRNVAQKFLQEVNKIKDNSEINSSDFIPLVMQFQDLQHSLDEIKTLMNKFEHLQNTLRTTRRYEGGLLIKSINNLVNQLCKKLGKQIQFKYEDFDSSSIPFADQSLVKEFLIVLTRYSVFYGIEMPAERKSANKDPKGTIEISTFSTQRNFGFIFKHDGRLVRIERLLQNTIESKGNLENKTQLGSEVIKLLFIPSNFPSNLNEAKQSKEVFLNMELAKKKLKMHGGKMKITFTSEQYCEYTISFNKKK